MRSADDLDTVQREACARYLDQLREWNARLNLTRIDSAEWWRRHIDESLDLAGHLEVDDGTRIVDIGSGCGVPGIPLAIVFADADVTLLEADIRKAGFLTHVCGVLALHNADVAAQRAEAAGHSPLRESFDIAVSRATAALPALCELALPLVRPGGRLVAMVRDAATDAAVAAPAAEALGATPPRAISAGLVEVVKVVPTPAVYPRRDGVPVRRPLLGGHHEVPQAR